MKTAFHRAWYDSPASLATGCGKFRIYWQQNILNIFGTQEWHVVKDENIAFNCENTEFTCEN